MKKIKNKIGYCQNKYLKGVNAPANKGHYVFIHKINKDGTCDVNTITSLENKTTKDFVKSKIKKIKNDVIYPIPYKDGNFTLWSGFNLKVIKNVKITNIKNIGCKNVKRKHLYYVGKFSKK